MATYVVVPDSYVGAPIVLGFPYARREFVMATTAEGIPVPIEWLSAEAVRLPALGVRVIIRRRTPLAKGLTDFGTGGRLLKDSVMGEYALRQVHYIEEQEDAGDIRCAWAGYIAPVLTPNPYVRWTVTGGEVVDVEYHGSATFIEGWGAVMTAASMEMRVYSLTENTAGGSYPRWRFPYGGPYGFKVVPNDWESAEIISFASILAAGAWVTLTRESGYDAYPCWVLAPVTLGYDNGGLTDAVIELQPVGWTAP